MDKGNNTRSGSGTGKIALALCEFRGFRHDIHDELAGFEKSSCDGALVGRGEVALGFEDGKDLFRREASCETEVAKMKHLRLNAYILGFEGSGRAGRKDW